jgi:hypothetical protein
MAEPNAPSNDGEMSDRPHLAERLDRVERIVMAWTASIATILVSLGAVLPTVVSAPPAESGSRNLLAVAVRLLLERPTGWSVSAGLAMIATMAIAVSAALAIWRLGAARSTSRIEVFARTCAVLAAVGTAHIWLVLWTPSDLFVDAAVGAGAPLLTIGVVITLFATFSRTYVDLWEG